MDNMGNKKSKVDYSQALEHFENNNKSTLDRIFSIPKPSPSFSSLKNEKESPELESDELLKQLQEAYPSARLENDGNISLDLEEVEDRRFDKLFDEIDMESGRAFISYKQNGNEKGNKINKLINALVNSKLNQHLSGAMDDLDQFFNDLDKKSKVEYNQDEIENIERNLQEQKAKSNLTKDIGISRKFR